jgi:tripartite-type tricarboxylate transporter receptor subunit TctC
MLFAKWFVSLIFPSTLALLQGVAQAQGAEQSWPSKPVRIIIPGTPGDSADLAGRLIGAKLQERLGQPFVIDNKPGAGNIIGTLAGKNAPYPPLCTGTA